MSRSPFFSLMVVAASTLVACGGGAGGAGGGAGAAASGASAPGTAVVACDGRCANASSALSIAQIETVIARAVAEAQARNQRATIAVVDRVGNVLAVYAMNGAPATVTVRSTSGTARIDGGLENVEILPATMAAISKAVTAAFLSSEGNAFSTRTASQIVQSHFNPGELLAPGGPLFGVQFSQLPCSDLSQRFVGSGAADQGPKRSPLGLSADPGGLPLYLAGTPVGGVGVVADGIYGLDTDIIDRDLDLDEAIALAASSGLEAPLDRRADRITADGKTLRFSDLEPAQLSSNPATASSFATLASVGRLVAVPGYTLAEIRAGTAFGQLSSGVRADSKDFVGLDAFVLVDATNVERFAPRAGTEAIGGLSAAETRAILTSALRTANRARAQIRRPLDTPAQVTISLVDSNGIILGLVRSRDAPVFGIDVSLQKARTAALMSSSRAAATLAALPAALYLDRGLSVLRSESPAQYVTATRAFLGVGNALGDGQFAFSARAIGNLARPNYPDGVDGNPAGPLSKPAGRWSPFSTGLQLDLVYNAIIQHVAFVAGLAPDVPRNCSGVGGFTSAFAVNGASPLLANGIQIFPGGVPIHRNGQLVGAIGVSGDGIDQDDMIAFLGVAESGLTNGIQHPTADRRADQLTPAGSRLRYVSCPQSPFLDSAEQEPCRGR